MPLTKKYRVIINKETLEVIADPRQEYGENDKTYIGEGFLGIEFDTLPEIKLSDTSVIWAQSKPYRLVVSNTEAIKTLFDGGELAELLKMLMPDFKEQFETQIAYTYIYLNNIDAYAGVTAQSLIDAYPNLFIRLEENTNFITANIVE